MLCTAANGTRYYTSTLLEVPHGIFTIQGGSSLAPYAGLNIGLHVGDERQLVQNNRQLIRQALALDTLCSVHQVHGDHILHIHDANQVPKQEPHGYDALITGCPGVGLLVQHADCQPILLFDPTHRVIAAIHNGWRGSARDIIATTIASMNEGYGTIAAELRALIGPGLGLCCAEFLTYREQLPSRLHAFVDERSHIDFPAISHHQLTAAGVCAEHIDHLNICTRCSGEFYSYRRAVQESQGRCGRNGSVIALPTPTGLPD